jgi:hypothetical protein
MISKVKSIYKRYQFCGGKEVYGTECSIDGETLEVSCICSHATLKGYDWTIIYYFIKKVDQGKVHLLGRYTKDKKNRSLEQVWHELSLEFNREMKFLKDEDIKTGAQLKELLTSIQGNVLIFVYMHTCIHAYMHTCMHTCIHTYIHMI